MIEESAVSYLDTSGHTITESNQFNPSTSIPMAQEPGDSLPKPPEGDIESQTTNSIKECDDSQHQSKSEELDWLARMQSQ